MGVSAGAAGVHQEPERSGWCWGGLATGGSREARSGAWSGGMAGGQAQGRRPAGCSRGPVPWYSGNGSRPPAGAAVWGYLPGRQVCTRNRSVRAGAGVVWQQVAAGSPGTGLGSAAWLAVGFRAGGRQGLTWAGSPMVWRGSVSRAASRGGTSCGGICQVGRSSPGTRAFGLAVRSGRWWQPGAPARGLARWYGWRLGSGPEAGRVQPWGGSLVFRKRQQAARNSSVRVGGWVGWQLAAAGRSGAGFRAGGWQGLPWGAVPGGVIWKRQQAASRCHGLGVCRVGVSSRAADHHQEPGRSVGGGEVWRQPGGGSGERGLVRWHGRQSWGYLPGGRPAPGTGAFGQVGHWQP